MLSFIIFLLVAFLFVLFVYNRYVQRKSSFLINYPVIARFRYLFELLREPFRQYFAKEDFL